MLQKRDLCLFCAVPAGVGRGCRWWRQLRKAGPPSTVSQDRGSLAQSLAGIWGAACHHWSWAGSELGIPGKREVQFMRLDRWPVVRLTLPSGNSKCLKVSPAQKHLCFLRYRESLKIQPHTGSVKTSVGPVGLLSASQVLLLCCTTFQRSQIRCVSTDSSWQHRAGCWGDLSPRKCSHSLRAAAAERTLQGTLQKRLEGQIGGPVGRSEDGLGEALRD